MGELAGELSEDGLAEGVVGCYPAAEGEREGFVEADFGGAGFDVGGDSFGVLVDDAEGNEIAALGFAQYNVGCLCLVVASAFGALAAG